MDLYFTFKKVLRRESGITLMELLVSSVLIAIVAIGAVSMDIAVRRMSQATSDNAIVSMWVTNAMNYVRKDIVKAIGDASNPGIYSFKGSSGGDTVETICFRHDETGTTPNNTPDDYTDDQWICYFHGDSNTVWRCPPLANSADNPCQSTTPGAIKLLDQPGPGFFNIITDSGGAQYIQITFTARANKSQPADPMTNPEYTLTTKIVPHNHSF